MGSLDIYLSKNWVVSETELFAPVSRHCLSFTSSLWLKESVRSCAGWYMFYLIEGPRSAIIK